MYRADSQREMSRLSSVLAAAPTPVAAVEAWIDHWIAIVYDRKVAKHLRVLWSTEARTVPGFRTVESESNHTSITLLGQALAMGRHRGDFPLVQPDDARVFQAAVVSLLEARLLRERPPTLAAARAHLNSFISRAIGCTVGST